MPDLPVAPSPRNPDVRHERSDVSVRVLFGFLAGILILGFFVHMLLHWTFVGLKKREERLYPPPLPITKDRPVFPRDLKTIPHPRLQEYGPTELDQVRGPHLKRLGSYGWVDEREGLVHIPIDQALKMFADPEFARKHGLPMRESPKEKRR